jgi:hypothetical protein
LAEHWIKYALHKIITYKSKNTIIALIYYISSPFFGNLLTNHRSSRHIEPSTSFFARSSFNSTSENGGMGTVGGGGHGGLSTRRRGSLASWTAAWCWFW